MKMKPTVKLSEKSRILSTRDYSVFEFPDFKMSKKHLARVKESIQEKNLSKDYPVLVDDKYRVIEGRYRFLACFELQLELYYKIAEVTELNDAVRIKHIHKNMHIEDVLKVYIDLKPYHDILLMKEEFNDEFGMNYIVQHIREAQYGFGRVGPTIDRKLFDSGRLSEWDFVKVKNQLNEVVQFLRFAEPFGFDGRDWFHIQDIKLEDPIFGWAIRNAQTFIEMDRKAFKDEHGHFPSHEMWDRSSAVKYLIVYALGGRTIDHFNVMPKLPSPPKHFNKAVWSDFIFWE